MSFQFDRWLVALIASTQARVSEADLLEISGLTDEDYLTEDIAILVASIDAELDEVERKRADAA